MIKRLGYKIKLFVFTILILIITIEIISLIAVKLNLLMYNEEPGYLYPSGDKWRTETMPWGSWHKPNFSDHHRETCFDVKYESNNLGARDNEPYNENLPKNSIILIGDSFAEGMGLQLEDTFAEVLEKRIGRKVLNFGSAAHFGPVQEEILYRTLASKLPHNEMIYFFLPANDFWENDRRWWNSKFNKFRHRPYFKKVDNDKYDIFYPGGKTENKILIHLKDFIFHRLQVFLIQYTYTANTLRTINALYSKYTDKYSKHTDKKNMVIRKPNIGHSYFFDDHEAINGALYFSKKLLSEASDLKRRLIVIFPEAVCVNSICRSKDLEMIYNGKDYKNLKWYLDLKRISSETDSKLFDLADHFTKEEWSKMALKCDGHPNPYGIRVIVELINRKFF